MVMEGSNVVGTTGGTVGVIGGVAKIASGMGTGGAGLGDAWASGIVSVGSLPCFVGTRVDCVCAARGGSRGTTMGWAPRGAK